MIRASSNSTAIAAVVYRLAACLICVSFFAHIWVTAYHSQFWTFDDWVAFPLVITEGVIYLGQVALGCYLMDLGDRAAAGGSEVSVSPDYKATEEFDRYCDELDENERQANRTCPHGENPVDCDACYFESDFAYDAAREGR